MRSLLARFAAAQGALGAGVLSLGLLLRFGVWVALVSLGAFMLVDAALRGRS